MINSQLIHSIQRTKTRGFRRTRSRVTLPIRLRRQAHPLSSPPFLPPPLFLMAQKWTILSAATIRAAAGYQRLLRECQAQIECHPNCEKPATHVLCPKFDAPRRSHPVRDAQNEVSHANTLSRSGRDANATPTSQHYLEAATAKEASMLLPPQDWKARMRIVCGSRIFCRPWSGVGMAEEVPAMTSISTRRKPIPIHQCCGP